MEGVYTFNVLDESRVLVCGVSFNPMPFRYSCRHGVCEGVHQRRQWQQAGLRSAAVRSGCGWGCRCWPGCRHRQRHRRGWRYASWGSRLGRSAGGFSNAAAGNKALKRLANQNQYKSSCETLWNFTAVSQSGFLPDFLSRNCRNILAVDEPGFERWDACQGCTFFFFFLNFWMACISMIMYKVTLWVVFPLCWDNVVC